MRQNLHNIDSIAVPKGMILTNFSKIQGWRNTFNFKLSIKERLPSKISAVLRFHLAVQPIKDVFGCRLNLNGFLGLSLNEKTILLAILLHKTVSVG